MSLNTYILCFVLALLAKDEHNFHPKDLPLCLEAFRMQCPAGFLFLIDFSIGVELGLQFVFLIPLRKMTTKVFSLVN